MFDSGSEGIPPAALWAHRLGQLSIASVFISVLLGVSFESIGINGLFLSLVIPLSLATVVLALAARRNAGDRTSPGHRMATLGLRMGLGVLISVAVFIVAVAVFFTLTFPRG